MEAGSGSQRETLGFFGKDKHTRLSAFFLNFIICDVIFVSQHVSSLRVATCALYIHVHPVFQTTLFSCKDKY